MKSKPDMQYPAPRPAPAAVPALFTPRRCIAAALAFFLLMLGVGAIPGKANALSAVIYDKLLHMTAYGFMSVLLYLGLSGRALGRGFLTLLTVGVMGALDEALQSTMSYRNASLADWQADMLAASLCVALLMLFHSIHLNAKKHGTAKTLIGDTVFGSDAAPISTRKQP